jgi:hypothetical protein
VGERAPAATTKARWPAASGTSKVATGAGALAAATPKVTVPAATSTWREVSPYERSSISGVVPPAA